MASAITRNEGFYRREAFKVVASTTNQVALSIDVNDWGGAADENAGLHFLVIIATVTGTPAARVNSIWSVHVGRDSNNNWGAPTATSLKAPTDAFVDFNMTVGNILQVRIDGGAAETWVIVEVQGPVGEMDTSV